MKTRTTLAFLVLLSLLPFATGCPSSPVAGDTASRQLVREATDVNNAAKAVYAGILSAHRAGLITDQKLVALEPELDAAEAGRKQLTADAMAGNVSKVDATKNAVLQAVGSLSAAWLEAQASPATRPAKAP